MRLEVSLLSIPLAFCLSLLALSASIATRSSKGVSLSLRTVPNPFFICNSSLSSFYTYIISYSTKRDKCAINRRLNVNQNITVKTKTFDNILSINNHTVEELKKQEKQGKNEYF